MPTATSKDMAAVAAEDNVLALPSFGDESAGGQQGVRLREYVDVIVTCVAATNNVRIRFADYDAEYNELLDEMAAHYCGCEAKAAEGLEQGQLYATLHDGRWLRVQTVGKCNGGKVR